MNKGDTIVCIDNNGNNFFTNAPILFEALQDLVRYCEENKVGAELEFAKDVLMKSGS